MVQTQLVKTITSQHYFKLIPIFCQIVSGFDEWSLKLESNWSKHLPPNTIWHSFLCYIIFPKCSAKSNNLKTLFHTHSYILYNRKNFMQNQAKSVREKQGRASLKNPGTVISVEEVYNMHHFSLQSEISI